jgi:hypothetical protein
LAVRVRIERLDPADAKKMRACREVYPAASASTNPWDRGSGLIAAG